MMPSGKLCSGQPKKLLRQPTMRAEFSLIRALISNWHTERIMGSYEKNLGGGGNRLIASEKLIKVYLLLPIWYRLNNEKETMKKKTCFTTRLSQRVYKRDFCSRVFANPDRYVTSQIWFQVNFDLPKLILNFLRFLFLIHEWLGVGGKGNWESTYYRLKKFNLKSNLTSNIY